MDHWYRFAKQSLHWTLPQVGDTPAAECWSDLRPLISWQLWLAREDCADHPLPWQKPQDDLSPGRVAQSFAAIIAVDNPWAVNTKGAQSSAHRRWLEAPMSGSLSGGDLWV